MPANFNPTIAFSLEQFLKNLDTCIQRTEKACDRALIEIEKAKRSTALSTQEKVA